METNKNLNTSSASRYEHLKANMSIEEFYIASCNFIRSYKLYCFDKKEDSKIYHTGLNWLEFIQNKALGNLEYMSMVADYLFTPGTTKLQKILSKMYDENNLIHFNAFSLIDTISTKI